LITLDLPFNQLTINAKLQMKNPYYVRSDQYEKGFAPIIIALIVAVILGGGYLIYKNTKAEAPTTTFSISGNNLSVVSDGKIIQTVSSLDKSEYGALAFGGSDSSAVHSFITDKDMNFDGHNDVGALSGTGYGGINYFYDFYIFNPITQKLEKNDILSGVGENIRLDPVKKQILSTFKSGSGYVTYAYQWNGSTFTKSGPLSVTNPNTTVNPTVSVTNPTTPSKTQSVTAAWKTYASTQYGFSFQYPSDKYVSPDSSSTTIMRVYPGSVSIGLAKVGTGQTKFLEIEVWDSESALNADTSYISRYNPVAIMIGNRPITVWNLAQQADARQIISTFKFTN